MLSFIYALSYARHSSSNALSLWNWDESYSSPTLTPWIALVCVCLCIHVPECNALPCRNWDISSALLRTLRWIMCAAVNLRPRVPILTRLPWLSEEKHHSGRWHSGWLVTLVCVIRIHWVVFIARDVVFCEVHVYIPVNRLRRGDLLRFSVYVEKYGHLFLCWQYCLHNS